MDDRERRDLVNRADELSRRLDAWDPVGVYARDEGSAPPGEYDRLVGPLLDLLNRGTPAEDIATWLRDELDEHFGVRSAPDARIVADELRRWWEAVGSTS